MAIELICWHCNKSLPHVILPMSRRETCPSCDADQHACRACEFYIGNTGSRCAEERAEHQSDTERANFCDYFSPRLGRNETLDNRNNQDAKAKLAALFGDSNIDSLPKTEVNTELSPAALAEKKLRDMLNK